MTTNSYRVITLSGEICTGTSTLAKSLEAALPGWQWKYTGQIFREFVASIGKTTLDIPNLPDSVHIDFDQRQKEIIQTQNKMIVEGRMSGWLSQGIPGVLKILCIADINTRVQRYMNRQSCEEQIAQSEISIRDAGDRAKYLHTYGIENYLDEKYFDLILDTTNKSPEELTKIVLTKLSILA